MLDDASNDDMNVDADDVTDTLENGFGADAEDVDVLRRAVHSFQTYRQQAHYNVTHRRRQSFYSLPSEHWQLLAKPPFSILANLDQVDDAIDANADIADAIVEAAKSSFLPLGFVLYDFKNEATKEGKATSADMGKASSTIRQFFRDWSAEGAEERRVCYGPILKALDVEYAHLPGREKGNIKVLVPGAGLGRLLFEIIRRGYSAEANEISYHQLIASSFILNHTERAGQFSLYPFALSFSHLQSRSHQLQRVFVPDVHPATELHEVAAEGRTGHMEFSAGDFCSVYRTPENADQYQVVATSFFIDTAPNLIRYIETVANCLQPGGLWINVGPLLWHFDAAAPQDRSEGVGATDDGIGEPGRVELTDEEVVQLVEYFGFSIEQRQSALHDTGYIQSPYSMLQSTYRCSFWVARKISVNPS